MTLFLMKFLDNTYDTNNQIYKCNEQHEFTWKDWLFAVIYML